MEATQLLEGALDESLPYYSAEDDENNFPKKLIGVMIIEENNEYNVFQGDTISIGRDPENCNIVLENKVITSKFAACIRHEIMLPKSCRKFIKIYLSFSPCQEFMQF